MNFSRFRKPSRYTGNEINIIRKEADIRTALCFPDTYEIGMSHIGLKILYSIINGISGVSAERAFAPWTDYESWLRKEHVPLASLESRTPLRDFNIVGFTLQYELSYTNVLNMLDLGGIPLKSRDRNDDYPLVIAGGPCAVNPLPLAPFIDAFVIGDGEEVVKEVIDVYSKTGRKKEDLLTSMAGIDGVYVPEVHDRSHKEIRKRIVRDLDNAPYPDAPVLPYTKIVHDRAAIEVFRGCTRGCRFCQAGMIYRPLRERSPGNVLSLARRSLSHTGYEEISFTSLSTGDYSSLLPLIRNFNTMCAGTHTAISLPSLRVGALNSEILKEIKSERKTGFTMAPEAGTTRLRNVINKDFTVEEYEDTLKRIFSEGWKSIKLYFMIGLPTETADDIDGLIHMAVKAMKKGKEITGRRVNVNVGISAFVPKAHTPFQWTGQDAITELRNKQDYIRRAFRRKGINFKGQHVEPGLLEAVFSRGGRESAVLLERAFENGCRFDGWSEMFDFDRWIDASEKAGIDLYEYASRSLDPDEGLPWDFIDTGVSKEFLKSEFRKALNQEMSPDCRSHCLACGLDCGSSKRGADSEHLKTGGPPRPASRKITVPSKVRIRFSKTGEMRYLSHNELITAIFRAMRRANIPVAYSTGFHPHPKVSFGPALPSGVEGLNEYLDMELTSLVSPQNLMKRLNNTMPEGLEVLNAALISMDEKSLGKLFNCYAYEIIIDNSSEKNINSFMRSETMPFDRNGKPVDIRPMVLRAEIKGEALNLTLIDTKQANARLFEILRVILGKGEDEVQELMIKRTGLYSYNSMKKPVVRRHRGICQVK